MFDRARDSVASLGAEALAETLDQAADRVDGQRGLAETRRLGAEMDGGQLVQPHHVVDDDDLGGDLGQPVRGRRSSGVVWASSSAIRRIRCHSLAHVWYPIGRQLRRSGVAAGFTAGHSHPATGSLVRPGHEHCVA